MHPGKMPMVSYWRTKEAVEAKLITDNGALKMVMDGEKYPMWGYPRGHLLIPAEEQYGPLSKLKHEIKNQIFNDTWKEIEEGLPKETILENAWKRLEATLEFLKPLKYDLMPKQSMCPAVREIHRAWTKVAPCEKSSKLRDMLCLILQEDDGYRYRVQWMAIWFPLIKINPIKIFNYALEKVEQAEVIRDMKERVRLLRRVLMFLLEDPIIRKNFNAFFKEVDWKKVRITEADRYHMRGKYFKTDMDVLEY